MDLIDRARDRESGRAFLKAVMENLLKKIQGIL